MRYLGLILFFCSVFLNAQSLDKGEIQKISNFIGQNLNVPQQAFDLNIDRIQYNMSFVVEKDGKISGYEILSKNVDCPDCETEIKRVFSILPAINPILKDGDAIRAKYTLPILITIPEPQPESLPL